LHASSSSSSIPDLAFRISGVDVPFADSDADVFAFLGEVDNQQSVTDIPLGLGPILEQVSMRAEVAFQPEADRAALVDVAMVQDNAEVPAPVVPNDNALICLICRLNQWSLKQKRRTYCGCVMN